MRGSSPHRRPSVHHTILQPWAWQTWPHVRIRIIACSSRSSPGRDARRISQSSLDARLHNRTGERPALHGSALPAHPPPRRQPPPSGCPAPISPCRRSGCPRYRSPIASSGTLRARGFHRRSDRTLCRLRALPAPAPAHARSCSPCGHIHTHTHSSMPRVPLARPSTRRCVDAPSRCRPGSHGPPSNLEPRASPPASGCHHTCPLPTPYYVPCLWPVPQRPTRGGGSPTSIHAHVPGMCASVCHLWTHGLEPGRSRLPSALPCVRTCATRAFAMRARGGSQRWERERLNSPGRHARSLDTERRASKVELPSRLEVPHIHIRRSASYIVVRIPEIPGLAPSDSSRPPWIPLVLVHVRLRGHVGYVPAACVRPTSDPNRKHENARCEGRQTPSEARKCVFTSFFPEIQIASRPEAFSRSEETDWGPGLTVRVDPEAGALVSKRRRQGASLRLRDV